MDIKNPFQESKNTLDQSLLEINRKFLLSILLTNTAWLISALASFKVAFTITSSNFKKSIQSQLVLNLNSTSYDQNLRFFNMLESLDLSKCTNAIVENSDGAIIPIIQRSANCRSDLPFFEPAQNITVNLPNGINWIIDFYIPLPSYYLWGGICLIILGFILILIYCLKRRKDEIIQIESLSRSLQLQNKIYDEARRYAHDIRSPITAFSTLAKTLENSNPAYSSLAKSAIEKMNNLTNEFLRTIKNPKSTGEQSHIIPARAFIDIVKSEIEQKELEIKSLNRKINFSFNHDVNFNQVLAPKEIQRIISNIINNSIEASEDDSTIFIKIEKLDKYIALSVEDQGFGIPSHILSKLGTTFITTKLSGNGFGIYDANLVLKKIGGHIVLKNMKKGLRASILLPHKENLDGL